MLQIDINFIFQQDNENIYITKIVKKFQMRKYSNFI